jgi:hypothetical protein
MITPNCVSILAFIPEQQIHGVNSVLDLSNLLSQTGMFLLPSNLTSLPQPALTYFYPCPNLHISAL